ncbi:hypothetical protein QBC39DRAFT_81585 [Podospora conica]|nr:hypothetical protein QBC39DRAFT_81585 [Schizothecium conicum]
MKVYVSVHLDNSILLEISSPTSINASPINLQGDLPPARPAVLARAPHPAAFFSPTPRSLPSPQFTKAAKIGCKQIGFHHPVKERIPGATNLYGGIPSEGLSELCQPTTGAEAGVSKGHLSHAARSVTRIPSLPTYKSRGNDWSRIRTFARQKEHFHERRRHPVATCRVDAKLFQWLVHPPTPIQPAQRNQIQPPGNTAYSYYFSQ